MESTELVVIETINPVELFTEEKIDALLEGIREKALSHKPNLKTVKGRQEIASMSGKVSKAKAALEKLTREFIDSELAKVDEQLSRIRVFKEGKKRISDSLAYLRDEGRDPLTRWEIEDKKKKEAEAVRKEIADAWDEAHEMNRLFDERLALEREKERLRLEEERKQAEAEAKLREEKAAEKARQEERDRLEKERVASAQREARAKEAAAKAEREKEEALARIEQEKQRAIREADEKRLAEEALKQAEDEKRKADEAHRTAIMTQAVDSMIMSGIPEGLAQKVIRLIDQGRVQHVSINY